jgi:DnaK suppressor protein
MAKIATQTKIPSARAKARAEAGTSNIQGASLTPEYSNDPPFPGGTYMNADQLDWFRLKLNRLIADIDARIDSLQSEEGEKDVVGDETDITQVRLESEQRNTMLERLWQSKLNAEIALKQIDEDEFGYCVDTGEEIGLERLRFDPTVRRTIEAQEQIEFQNKMRRT